MIPARLHELLDRGQPGAPAVSYAEETLTYHELRTAVVRAAAGLQALGVRPGERVAVYLDKRLETVVAMLAVSAVGAILVPVNPVLRPRQVAHILTDSTSAVLLTTAERAAALSDWPAGLGAVRDVVLVGDRTTVVAGRRTVSWADLLASGRPQATPWHVAPAHTDDAVAAIFYTSGSTGGPKGVVLGHRNLLVGAESVAGYLRHTPEDVVLSVLPLSFDAGFSQLSTTFAAGAHVVLLNYLTPGDVVRRCERHAVTALTCVPPLWWRLAEASWPVAAGRSLRYFASTGGRMPAPVLARLRQIFPQAAPYLMYGLTEAFRSTYLDPTEIDRRPGSIGRAIPYADVRVVRPDGRECAADEPGELVHGGPLVARGYWNDPVRTAERFRAWPPGSGSVAVWSGDTVRRDEDGFLYFVGRADDLIKTSGYRVSPSEIEDAAYASGLVAEALAYGVDDEHLGQRIVLAVSGPAEAACDTRALSLALRRELPSFQVPHRIVDLGPLPRSPNGKFDRAAIRLRGGVPVAG